MKTNFFILFFLLTGLMVKAQQHSFLVTNIYGKVTINNKKELKKGDIFKLKKNEKLFFNKDSFIEIMCDDCPYTYKKTIADSYLKTPDHSFSFTTEGNLISRGIHKSIDLNNSNQYKFVVLTSGKLVLDTVINKIQLRNIFNNKIYDVKYSDHYLYINFNDIKDSATKDTLLKNCFYYFELLSFDESTGKYINHNIKILLLDKSAIISMLEKKYGKLPKETLLLLLNEHIRYHYPGYIKMPVD